MQSGSEGGGMGGGKKPSDKEKLQLSTCDLASNEFKKTWLTLKELHDKELQRLQAKLTSLRKERLADGRWTGSIAKIKELTEQQKVLSGTIHDLRDQLSTRICDRCSVNETYRNTLQQEFYDIQQQNLKFISELTAERNKLREENKKLSEKLKLSQKQLVKSSTDSDVDFVPTTQRKMPDYSLPRQGTSMHLPSKVIKQPHTDQMKSGGKKEPPQSSSFPAPLCSQNVFDVPETSFEKTFYGGKAAIGGSGNQKFTTNFPLSSTFSSQRGFGFQGAANLPEDKLKRKQRSTQNPAMQKCDTHSDFSWNISSVSTGENPATHVASETSEENMPDCNRSLFPPFTPRMERPSLSVFPLDYTLRSSGKRRLSINLARPSTGFSVRDDSSQPPSKEQSTLRKNTAESTSAVYTKPQSDTPSCTVGSTLKRKARVQTEKRGK
ncbi:DNA endonuclease RBBP8 [Galemys pyrenaicus]|uniref:DNA endonuclease RBBP8 n=1 Tax=Galemys pyrenaicus TaxID=202257 RepID=A0A8J6DLJ3_GALPY|nr:DNA endonuclease RBBP8 [Galemys pyrenaicus]